MSSWSSGYVSEVDYTYGYYAELNPNRIKLAFLNAGIAPPNITTACELGFGQGLSVNMHAAGSMCKWFGTDINPAQVGFAKEMAIDSRLDVQLFDESFEEFAARDLPEFDYIGLHGIWSWISNENREIITKFIKKRLKIGGVVYISYNTLPGWSSFAPMRHLMSLHVEKVGNLGLGLIDRIENSLNFSEKLLETNPIYAQANPSIAGRLKSIKSQDKKYLAHEYFNRDWHPMHFEAVAKCMESAKLTFACSADYLDFVDGLNFTAEQQKLLNEVNEPNFKQTVRDYIVNQQFRKDYWVKGARKLSLIEQTEEYKNIRLIMTQSSLDVTLELIRPIGNAALSERIYLPIIELMKDHKIRTLQEIEVYVKKMDINFSVMLQAVLILCGKGVLCTAQEDATIKACTVKTDKLNKHILLKSKGNGNIGNLVSPVTGGGFSIDRFQQLFILSMQEGNKTTEEIVAYVTTILEIQGQKLIKDGNILADKELQFSELFDQVENFKKKILPIVKSLKIL